MNGPLQSAADSSRVPSHLIAHINVKLALIGCSPVAIQGDRDFIEIADAMAAQSREKDRLLGQHLCPADQRIQNFIHDYLQEIPAPKLPARTFTLDRPGLARVLSLPVDRNDFTSDIINSYRVKQGVLHNPKSDRRTTAGIFHVAEGGLPIPDDKLAVPKATFAKMLALALTPPAELLKLPFTSTQAAPAECFVSLLLRPLVCPEIPGFTRRKTMEVRFFVPGNLVSNLDFVEAIFENGGDPLLPENDAALDTDHWSGHTGCVILAPHLIQVTKQAAGLPQYDQATERQRRDGMCWKTADELYNGGHAFKLTARDENGVILTLIADNYFGYCKKEVKTQLSFAANLFGLVEEEHAGGALVFPSYDLGEEFNGDIISRRSSHSFAQASTLFADLIDVKPEGYGLDKKHSDIVYVPAAARFDLHTQTISWTNSTGDHSIRLSPEKTYVRPNGYKVKMEKPAGQSRQWRLVGTVAEGTFCHKPCTVSGGGKSEISKPITDAVITGPVFVSDLKEDFDHVAALIERDYSGRFADKSRSDYRKVLSPERSLGSVIKLLTPDEHDYTPEYNDWLASVPQHVKELVFVVKRYYKPEWEGNWRDHFSVNIINGTPGNELKCDNHKLVTTYLRVGFDADGSWRTFGLRKDFHPAVKVQMEDDITASAVVPAQALIEALPAGTNLNLSLKFVQNCEQRLFQRPDDAIHRGYDKQAESDFTQPDTFFSNYEPLTPADAQAMVADAVGFCLFTEPMQDLVRAVAQTGTPDYYVCTASPRLVNGKPTKNPRYLQKRPDQVRATETYLAGISARLCRRVPLGQPLHTPVTAVLPGRRNNPPEPGVRSLACYNPIHYMELPELFMEVICSMTGKSPSTTGAGSEGALTKGPFNALPPIMDLNNALVSFILTGHTAFVTAAGYVGPKLRVDHDVSLIVPEVWCRMMPKERDPNYLIAHLFLEKCTDFEHAGKKVLASRLGWRINARFVHAFFGRVFNHPHAVFTEAMLKPELQDLDIFADGMENIVATQRRVAQLYFNDGSIQQACPPLKALLHIMLHDQFEGQGLDALEIRQLFTRENLLASPWYAARLAAKQRVDRKLWKRHVEYLNAFLHRPSHVDVAEKMGIASRLARARETLKQVESPEYLRKLSGTLGAEPVENYAPVR